MLVIVLLCIICSTQAQSCEKRKPILILSGILASQLMIDADIDTSIALPPQCPHKVKGQIWINRKDLIPFNNSACFVEYMKTYWNSSTRKMENIPGANIYYPDFPSTKGIFALAPDNQKLLQSKTKVFAAMIRDLKAAGWKDGIDLVSPGYDWRYADRSNNNWTEKTTQLIQQLVHDNGHKVVIVTHSFGGIAVLDLISSMSKEFCDQYIDKIITLNAPFIGSTKTLRTFLTGEDLGLKLDPLLLRPLARSWESDYQLMPNQRYWKNDNIVQVGNKKYSANNINAIIDLVEEVKEFGNIIYNSSINRHPLEYVPNNVTLHCLYSHGIETIVGIKYDSLDHDFQDVSYVYGDGDGVVDLQSLEWCKLPGFAKVVKDLGKGEHGTVISNTEVFGYIKNEACARDSNTKM
ncbi:1-O-acylceramide synthase precursor, putative [Entamoeba dispar SAW760]|uniref:1-O-acylceramide synthase, putative n=1 Tax=Entamoeba dispar (strain ATCC PRA-260 / SAW760) TaxID=370354 RepID=B0E8I2_ENTDS|nr:1-O-acylceramide synthase precursor, putative [Entamoeba dispar SAW760]EDR29163.1 1-O-acylceramide synthase precursor, putative [Entamoeba dispar SAW760]|eukprot:EDR29163.1 1-O-acylceramide synthase precursor, putative [Entamoeba dispar SAW760]